MSKPAAAIIFAVALIVGTRAYVWFDASDIRMSSRMRQAIHEDILDTAALRRTFVREFTRGKDPGKTYEILKRAVAPYSLGTQHLAAHVFGETLFGFVGVRGLGVCDGTVAGFGCVHGFFGQAIAQMGSDVVFDFDRECQRIFDTNDRSGCAHGIGHGLGEYYGPEKIVKQLEICATLSRKEELFGCNDGVFMEYHFPFMVGADGPSVGMLPLEEGHEYVPCEDIGDRYIRSCFFNLPSWWRDVFNGSSSHMEQLCVNIRNATDREYCFLGIGYGMAMVLGDDIETMKEYCDGLAATNAQILCRAGASSFPFHGVSTKERTQVLCDGTEEYQQTCVAKTDLLTL